MGKAKEEQLKKVAVPLSPYPLSPLSPLIERSKRATRTMIKNLNHVCLIVKDLDRAIRFYRDVLGLRVSKIISIEGEYPQKVLGVKGVKISYAKLSVPDRSERGRPVLELHCWQRPRILPKKSYSHISFGLKDINNEYRRLRKKGVRFISKPLTAPDGHAKMCFGLDPDGNRIEFIEEMKH